MRTLLAGVLVIFMASCNAETHKPVARVEISATAADQVRVIEATKEFGKRNGFSVVARDSLPKEGRDVMQVDLEHSDGSLIAIDNFMDPQELHVFFYAKRSDTSWAAKKAAWLDEVYRVMQGRGEIRDVPNKK